MIVTTMASVLDRRTLVYSSALLVAGARITVSDVRGAPASGPVRRSTRARGGIVTHSDRRVVIRASLRCAVAGVSLAVACVVSAAPTTIFRYDNNGNLHAVTDPDVDVNNCGGVGIVCPRPAQTVPACRAGGCVFACTDGWADCDGNVRSNGCEASLLDVNTCGTCGNRCSVPTNGFARCLPAVLSGGPAGCDFGCNAGYSRCGMGCVSLPSDVDNCGTCGARCSRSAYGVASCAAGTCRLACYSGYAWCSTPTGANRCYDFRGEGPSGCWVSGDTLGMVECIVAPRAMRRVDSADTGPVSVREVPDCATQPGLAWPRVGFVECAVVPRSIVRVDMERPGSVAERALPDCSISTGLVWPR